MGLIITLVLGLFILIGASITIFSKNNKKFIDFSLGLAFSVITMLIIVELIPHTYETLISSSTNVIAILAIIISVITGVLVLKVLDSAIPHHHGDHVHNIEHIGIVTSIALVLHNIIEGMAVYNVVSDHLSVGLLMAVGVGIHNIPLGMVVTSALYKTNNSKKKTAIYLLIVSLSTFVGGLIMFFASSLITEIVEGLILAITIGMLSYISVVELLPKIIKTKEKKNTIIGVIIGIIIIFITMIFHHH